MGINVQNGTVSLLGCTVADVDMMELCHMLNSTESTIPSITTLFLSSAKISTHGMSLLMDALKTNTSVTSITLPRLNAVASSIADVLLVNTTLRYIYFGKCASYGKGMVEFANSLKINTSVTDVDFGERNTESIVALADALKVNSTITNVNLSRNIMTALGMRQIAEALEINSTVARVYMGDCHLDCSDLSLLADALKVNTSITSIDLSRNEYGLDRMHILSEALTINSTLTSIRFTDHVFLVEEMKQLAAMLTFNTSIASIDFESCGIDFVSLEPLADALYVNFSITSIDLCCNQLYDVGRRMLIDDVLVVNTTITHVDVYENPIHFGPDIDRVLVPRRVWEWMSCLCMNSVLL